MKFFSKRGGDEEDSENTPSIRKRLHINDFSNSIPILIRQLIYDSLLTPPEEIAEALGLPAISDEVAEMEERASQERLEKFSELLPFITAHSEISSKISTAAYLVEIKNTTGTRPDNDEIEDMARMMRLVSLASTMSCLSTLATLGVIRFANEDEEE